MSQDSTWNSRWFPRCFGLKTLHSSVASPRGFDVLYAAKVMSSFTSTTRPHVLFYFAASWCWLEQSEDEPCHSEVSLVFGFSVQNQVSAFSSRTATGLPATNCDVRFLRHFTHFPVSPTPTPDWFSVPNCSSWGSQVVLTTAIVLSSHPWLGLLFSPSDM